MTDRAVRHVTTPFGEIAYTEQGAGPPALFVHGIFLNGYLWRHVVDGVADLRRCISVDILGHGETRTPPDADMTFDAHAAMLEAVCDALDLETVDVVANDSGGGIAQIFAARRPQRVRTLTLTNSDVHDNWPPPALAPILAAVREGRLGAIGRPNRHVRRDPNRPPTSLSFGFSRQRAGTAPGRYETRSAGRSGGHSVM